VFTSDAAKIIGTKPKALRAFLRTYRKGVGSGSRYEFSYEEVEELSKAYWATQPEAVPVKQKPWLGDGGRVGLPHEWLGDPEKEALFVAENKARLERMAQRLHEVGLSVPQMTENDLKVNNRAIMRALLQGNYRIE
jgi:hypothetical protein